MASKVYPRVCGGNAIRMCRCFIPVGLSPRVRGKPLDERCPRPHQRSIPACAGETHHAAAVIGKMEVYPRVCGGNDPSPPAHRPPQGLSPRVRGKLPYRRRNHWMSGSIPACAGETPNRHRQRPPDRVYPRVCGGNQGDRIEYCVVEGLSPRVRGKPYWDRSLWLAQGSIPACAGETRIRPRKRL